MARIEGHTVERTRRGTRPRLRMRMVAAIAESSDREVSRPHEVGYIHRSQTEPRAAPGDIGCP